MTGRPTNLFRALATLYEWPDGVTHQYLRYVLGLSKESYRRLRSDLASEGFTAAGVAGGNRLALSPQGRKKFEKDYAGQGRVDRERDLYEPLAEKLREQNEEHVVLNVGALRRRGAWQNPDVIRVVARPGALGVGSLLRLCSYEVKTWNGGFHLASVFEAAAHGGFSHEAHLVIEWAEDVSFSHEYLDAYGAHILEGCRRFGVGLLILHPVGKSHWKLERALLAVDQHPNELEVHEYVDYVMRRKRFAAERAKLSAALGGGTESEDESEGDEESPDVVDHGVDGDAPDAPVEPDATCRREGCPHPPRRGNYGFCGVHRRPR